MKFEESKFSNQNWNPVLNHILEYAPNRYGRGTTGYDAEHPIAERLKVKPNELSNIMTFLEEQGLIEYAEPDINWIQVTSKGFDVAGLPPPTLSQVNS